MSEPKPKLLPNVSPPTGDIRHIAKIRHGKQSAEVFCRNPKRREELGLPVIKYTDDQFVEDLRR